MTLLHPSAADPYECINALWRDVSDDSTPLEKALWHALDALREIDDGGPHVNHVQHVAARGLERVERALRGFTEGPTSAFRWEP